MKINLTAGITDIDGKPVVVPDETGAGVPMTLRSVIQAALITPQEADRHASGDVKFKLFELALKTSGVDIVDYSVDDVALIKARIGQAFPPLTVGRAWQLLDPREETAAPA